MALGIAGAGLSIIFFLIKFLFKRHKIDRSDFIEIKRHDEPALFKIIDEIVQDVGTKKPKRVYLSHEVNASVFYDSGFWSMFLPVEKNLVIGLGLVQSVNQSELKAILAHEFGHFSQRSMKVGSYVYQVNQVIFNMLNDNHSFNNAIGVLSSQSVFVLLPILLAIKLIHGIQWILAQMYAVVNKSYMALSREMEFHADEIAARVNGIDALKSSLLRLDFANLAHQAVQQFYIDNSAKNWQTKNLFEQSRACMKLLAERNELIWDNGFPQIRLQDFNRFKRTQVEIQDQWASHPSLNDRIQRLDALGLNIEKNNHNPSSELFQHLTKYEEQFTEKFFNFFENTTDEIIISLEDFTKELTQFWNQNDLPKIFNGYYDYRNIETFDVDKHSALENVVDFSEFFNDEKLEWVRLSIGLHEDIKSLRYISENPKSVQSFDYNGEKFGSKASKYLPDRLEKEHLELKEKLQNNDIEIFRFFKGLALKQNLLFSLENNYKSYFDFVEKSELGFEIYTQINQAIQFVAFETPLDEIQSKLNAVRKLETQFKGEILDILKTPILKKFVDDSKIDPQLVDDLNHYCSKNWEYFGTTRYINENLEVLYRALNNFFYLLDSLPNLLKRDILKQQESLLT